MSDYGINSLIVSRSAPGLDPSSVYAVARSNANSLPTVAQATQGFSDLDQLGFNLKQQPADVQRQQWNTYDDSTRQMLTAAGYEPPKSHFGSFLGHVFHDVTHNDITKEAGEKLNVLGAPLRLVQHGIRTMVYDAGTAEVYRKQHGEQENGPHYQGQGSGYTLHDWIDAWHKTTDGQKAFDPSQTYDLNQKYNPDDVALAQKLASGLNPDDLMRNTPPAQQAALFAKLQDPEFQKVARLVDQSHISFGREVAYHVGLANHPAGFRYVSGAADMMQDLYLDPVIIGGKASKAYEASKYAVNGSEDVQNLYKSSPQVQRAMQDIAETAGKENGQAALINRYPKLAPFAKEIVQNGANNPDGVAQVFADKADAVKVLQGESTQQTVKLGKNIFGVNQVPKLNPVDLAKLNATSTVRDGINALADSDSVLGSALGKTAKSMTTLTTQVRSIRPGDPDSNIQIKRYLDSFLPSKTSDELLSQYISAPTEGAKAQIYLSMNESVMRAAGLPDDAIERMLGKLRDTVGSPLESRGLTTPGEAYGVGDSSLMDTAKGTVAAALHGPQVDDVEWAMPSYRQLRQAAAHTSVLSHIGAAIEAPALDALIEKAWKPSVLLRMGFPVRAGGEELASALIREGAGPIRGRLAVSSVLGQARAQDLVDARSAVDSLTDKLQTAIDHFNAGRFEDVNPGESYNRIEDTTVGANRYIQGLSDDLTNAQQRLAETRGDHLLPAINVHPFSWMLDHLRPDTPEGQDINWIRDMAANKINNARDLAGAVIGGPWDRLHDKSLAGFRTLEGTLAGGAYTTAAKELYDMFGDSMLADAINAQSSHGGYWETPAGFQGALNKGGRGVRAYLEPTGKFQDYGSADPSFVSGWLRRLREVSVPGASDPARVALQTVDQDLSLTDRIARVADALEDPKYAGWRSKFMRDGMLSDGRLVGPISDGSGGSTAVATVRDASEDWAHKIIKDVDGLVYGQDGTFLKSVRDQILDSPTKLRWQDLQQIPIEARPTAVNAPAWTIHPIGHWQSFLESGFDNIVGRPMNWITRQGAFLDAYVKSKADLEPALQQLKNAGFSDADEIIQRTAAQRAADNMIPFIHDPTQRSQFSVITRNLIPFWFAQEQFYKRWARTIAQSPDGFRKAQLLMNGIEHSGFVHTDDQGNKYFMYPGMGIANKTLARVFQTVTGQSVTMPVPVGFKGELRFVNPGVEHATSLPSPSPIVALPLHALTNMFPELAPVEQTVSGRGAGLSYWEQVTPPSVARFVHVLDKNPDTDPQLMSAMAEAMKWAAANRQMPSEQLPDGSPNPDFAHEQEQFNARVRDQARVILLSRAMLGFVAPASPELAVGSPELNTELQTLMGKGMPYTQALQTFLALHPDASAYTVFKTDSPSGAPLPATTKAAQFMADNEGFLKKYPQAGGWFIPQTSNDMGKFSSAAWNEQFALQLRERKTFKQIEDDIYHAQAAQIFYKQKDLKDSMLQNAFGFNKQRVQNAWDQWSQSFLAAHPVFAQDYLSSTGVATRSNGVNQINMALKDGGLPDTAQTKSVKELMYQYNNYRAVKTSTAGLNSAIYKRQRDNAKKNFVDFAHSYLAQHPEVQPLYDKMIRPDVETGQ